MCWIPAVLAALAGCAGVGEPTQVAPLAPGEVLVVYHHGSNLEWLSDGCRPSPPGFAAGDLELPAVLAELDRDPFVRVVAVCTNTVGDREARHLEAGRAMPCTPAEGASRAARRQLKVCKRAKLMREWLAGLAPAPPRERVFFAGRSAGAWASLLLAAGSDRPFNAVIAFAPAFSGDVNARRRLPALNATRKAHYRYLESRAALPALAFGSKGDPYEDPEDQTGLARLRAVPEFHLVVLPDDGSTCQFGPHFCADVASFVGKELPLIEAYILCRVADPAGACAPHAE